MSKLIFLFLLGLAYSNAASIKPSADQFELFLRRSVNGVPNKNIDPSIAKLQNVEEISGKFEGDIVLTEEQIRSMVNAYKGNKNAILSPTRLWPNKTVVYEMNGPFTAAQQAAVELAMSTITQNSCVKFRKRVNNERAYMSIEGGTRGCYATVGYTGYLSVVNFAPGNVGEGCYRFGTLVHEFLHGLGFYHMHSSHDRDSWVSVIWDKIPESAKGNFNKYTPAEVSHLGEQYDYGSVMHYSEYGFSIDGSKTLVPLKPVNVEIGQRYAMSQSDVRRLNKLYSCPGY